MAYVQFHDDATGFKRWRETHPNAIVVNSSPGRLDPKYVKAHRPECTSFGHENRTTVYSKQRFDSAAEALGYLKSKSIEAPTFGCKTCRVALLLPTDDPVKLAQQATVLLQEDIQTIPPGNLAPRRVQRMGSDGYERDPLIVAWILQKAAGKCELCEADAPFWTH